MSNNIGFYVVGRKGLFVLTEVLEKLGSSSINYVVAGRDGGVVNDYFDEIRALATRHELTFFPRDETGNNKIPVAAIEFAIGWKWLLRGSRNLVVFHDSILPTYRGFAPLVNSLIMGEKKLGVSALQAVQEYDAGPIIAQATVDVSYPLKIADAIELICPLYAELALSVHSEFVASGTFSSTAQNEAEATYSPWRDHYDYLIPWSESAHFISRFCDAVGSPYEGALTYKGKRAIRILDAHDVDDLNIVNRGNHVGKIIANRPDGPLIICGKGLLQIRDAVFDDNGASALPDMPLRTRFTDRPSV